MADPETIHLALSGEFFEPDGRPAWPGFDMAPLLNDPRISHTFLPKTDEISPEHIADVDVLILLHNRVTESSFHPNGRLAMITRFGAGYDKVDVEACTHHCVPLVTTPAGVQRPMAVAIITLILALTTKLTTKIRLAREGMDGFNKRSLFMGEGLVGKTLGSIGLGNIGSELFRLAQPFSMKYLACDPYVDPARAHEFGVKLVSLKTLLNQSDIVVVNCPYTPKTHHLINSEHLMLMKPDSYLVNTARGPIVDQAALSDALCSRKIFGAALDVLEHQPLSTDNPLLYMDNVIITPNALGWTDELCKGNGEGVTRSVIELLEGRSPSGVLNREVLLMPKWQARLLQFRKLTSTHLTLKMKEV